MLLFITITCPFGDGHAHFWFPSLSFGKPDASTLAPWGTMGAIQGDLGIHEGHLGVQAWIFIDFGWMTESTPRVIGVAVGKRQLVK